MLDFTPLVGSDCLVATLGARTRVTLQNFNGSRYVDIRDYFIPKDSNDLKATRRGVTLNSTEWSSIMQHRPEIEAGIVLQRRKGHTAETEETVVITDRVTVIIKTEKFYINPLISMVCVMISKTGRSIVLSTTKWKSLMVGETINNWLQSDAVAHASEVLQNEEQPHSKN